MLGAPSSLPPIPPPQQPQKPPGLSLAVGCPPGPQSKAQLDRTTGRQAKRFIYKSGLFHCKKSTDSLYLYIYIFVCVCEYVSTRAHTHTPAPPEPAPCSPASFSSPRWVFRSGCGGGSLTRKRKEARDGEPRLGWAGLAGAGGWPPPPPPPKVQQAAGQGQRGSPGSQSLKAQPAPSAPPHPAPLSPGEAVSHGVRMAGASPVGVPKKVERLIWSVKMGLRAWHCGGRASAASCPGGHLEPRKAAGGKEWPERRASAEEERLQRKCRTMPGW